MGFVEPPAFAGGRPPVGTSREAEPYTLRTAPRLKFYASAIFICHSGPMEPNTLADEALRKPSPIPKQRVSFSSFDADDLARARVLSVGERNGILLK
jgi:hypothetical protein